MTKLRREPVVRHPWKFHRWQDVDGMAGLFGLVKQCERCNLVEVFFPLTMSEVRGSHLMLVDG